MRSKHEIRGIVDGFAHSGMTRREYCEKHNIGMSTLDYWRRIEKSKPTELFFRTPDNRIMVAEYTVKGDSFAADKPRVWSEKKLADFGLIGIGNYDLAPKTTVLAVTVIARDP